MQFKLKHILFLIISMCSSQAGFSQFTLMGAIRSKEKQVPVAYARISIPALDLWTISNEKGVFAIKNVPVGKLILQAECLGYVKTAYEISVTGNINNQQLSIPENNLALDEVVITSHKSNSLQTSFLLNRTVLDHMQVLGVKDAAALLPGGKTNPALNLASSGNQYL